MRTRIMQTVFVEAEIKSTRASGPGGQHVNKTSSAIQVKFSITQSYGLTPFEKEKLLARLQHRIVQGEFLMMRSEEERDQISNKKKAVEKIVQLIMDSLIDPKKRVKTRVPYGAKVRRSEDKKIKSAVKKTRQEKIRW
jgi:ribosome-associated protein